MVASKENRSTKKVLVVDDERVLVETIGYNLRREGYATVNAYDGGEALAAARREKPDAIILDVMLPGLSGFEVCSALRRETTVPILMLTAREGEVDKVLGLELGADDYLTKPFSMRELLARVKAQLRRGRLLREELGKPSEPAPHETLTFDDLAINLTRREVTLNGAVLALKPKEYELLLFFAEHKSHMLSREFILERVWGWDYVGDSRTVDVHVRWLRQKLEKDSANPMRIITVRGGGYRFEG